MALATSAASKSGSLRLGPKAARSSVVWTESGRATKKTAWGGGLSGGGRTAEGADAGARQAPNFSRARESIWSAERSPAMTRRAWSGRNRRACSAHGVAGGGGVERERRRG